PGSTAIPDSGGSQSEQRNKGPRIAPGPFSFSRCSAFDALASPRSRVQLVRIGESPGRRRGCFHPARTESSRSRGDASAGKSDQASAKVTGGEASIPTSSRLRLGALAGVVTVAQLL